MKTKGVQDHLSVGLDGFLRRLDWDGQALAFAALVRVFTLGQAARLICKASVYAAESVLERLVWKEELLGRMEEVRLPKGCGHGKTAVYYLTRKGAERLASLAPTIAGQARPGRPRGTTRARIPHELLVAEAYLWLAERYEVFEFWPETELKRRLLRARAAREGGFIRGLSDEATGDFKALVIARGEGEEERWIHGEVVVRYDARQVKGKPDDVLWFARDSKYADLVEYVKGCPTVLLGDVREPLNDRRSGAENQKTDVNVDDLTILTQPEQRLLRALDAMGGLATATALALILDRYRTHVSHTLKSLEAKGKLCGVDAQLVPGCDTGRPMRVYARDERPLESVWEKIRGLIRSRIITEMAASGYRFFHYDGAIDAVEFRDRTGSGKAPIIAVIDDPRRSLEHLANRMVSIKAHHQPPLAVVQSAVRATHLRLILMGRIHPVLICDVSSGHQGRPWKTRIEPQKLTIRERSTVPGEQTGSEQEAGSWERKENGSEDIGNEDRLY